MTEPTPRPPSPPRKLPSGIEAVVFDLWDTLVPYSRQRWAATSQEIARVLGVPVERFRVEWAASFDARTTGALESNVRDLCVKLGVGPDPRLVTAVVALRAEFSRSLLAPPREAIETLAELRRRFGIGLVSDCSSDVPDIWAASPLASLVDAAVFSCSVGAKKPDARVYRLVCARLGVAPSSCVYVGDGGSDELRGAAAVGMTPVQLAAPGLRQRPWAGRRIRSLRQILSLRPTPAAPAPPR